MSKSGTNSFHGSLYEFHRNDNLDARNFFDGSQKPEFKRNQFGGSFGGPIKPDRTFFFFGYESLRENLGQTIRTVVPDINARNGILPTGGNVTVNSAVKPYLDEFPLPNGANLGGGLAEYNFGFNRQIAQHFLQGRVDQNGTMSTSFSRVTRSMMQTSNCQPTSRSSRDHFVHGTNSSRQKTALFKVPPPFTPFVSASVARASANK